VKKKKTVLRKDPVEEALVGIAREALRAPITPAAGMALGISAFMGILAVQKYMPSMRGVLGRTVTRIMQEADIMAALRGQPAQVVPLPWPFSSHPEAAQPRRPINERQLGRSEVINEIARGKMN
jgi:hypothetical protein